MSTAVTEQLPAYADEFSHLQHPKKRAFLTAFAQIGIVRQAAKAADINRGTHNNWLNDPSPEGDEYRAAFELAKQYACEYLELEAFRRATQGVDEPIYQGGEQVGIRRRYSDTLLIFLMKAAMPEKYADRRYEHRTNIEIKDQQIELAVEKLSIEQLQAVTKLLENAGEAAGVVLDVESSEPGERDD